MGRLWFKLLKNSKSRTAFDINLVIILGPTRHAGTFCVGPARNNFLVFRPNLGPGYKICIFKVRFGLA